MKEILEIEDRVDVSPSDETHEEVVQTSRKVVVGDKVWYISPEFEKYMKPEFTQQLTEHMHRAKRKALEQLAE